MGNLSDWSAVSGVISGSIDLYHLIKEHIPRTSSSEKEVPPTLVSSPVQEEQEQIEPYRTQLGRRHKSLRENILQLNPREMASFYDFEETEKLEKCEAGLEEFPTKAIKKLEDFFFVNPKYLQEEKKPIFQNFRISCTRADCRRLLEQSFHPYFLCSPRFNYDGFAYLVFWKEEGGYWRMVRSDVPCGFRSNGGGANNIYQLIYSMLDLDVDPRWSNFLCLDVSQEEWSNLNKGCWYNKGMRRGYGGTANNEAREIYERWFGEFQAKRMSRNSIFHEH
jgi:hypothetical protein